VSGLPETGGCAAVSVRTSFKGSCVRGVPRGLFVDRVTEGQSNFGSSEELINFNRCAQRLCVTRGICTQADSHGFDRAGRGGRHGLLVCV
jgi:hypothetical protein